MSVDEEVRRFLDVGDDVARVLLEQGVEPLLIGSVALAVHGYVRATRDLDIGVAVDVSRMRELQEQLGAKGFDVSFDAPDAQDPLGGVLNVESDGMLVQIVNFDNSPSGGFPRVIRDAVAGASRLGNLNLVVSPASHLVAMKLYAGGPKSLRDIQELVRHAELDLEEVRALCRGYRLPVDQLDFEP